MQLGPSARRAGVPQVIAVLAAAVVGGVVTFALNAPTMKSGGDDDGAPSCTPAYGSASPGGGQGTLARNDEIACEDALHAWCRKHQPEDEDGCFTMVLLDGSLRSTAKN